MIDYNVSILNYNDPTSAFFCLAKDDPTVGFPYDATRLTGHLYPKTATENLGKRIWRHGVYGVACTWLQTARLTLPLLKPCGYMVLPPSVPDHTPASYAPGDALHSRGYGN